MPKATWLLNASQGSSFYCTKRCRHFLRIPIGTNDHNWHRGRFHDPTGCIEPIHLWHIEIHSDHIWTLPSDELNSLSTIIGCTNDTYFRVGTQNVANECLLDRRIFDNEDFDHNEGFLFLP